VGFAHFPTWSDDMNNKVGKIIIGTETPSGRPDTDWGNFAWIDTANRQVKTFNGGTWGVVADFADTFKPEGVSEEIPIKKIDTLVFENGLLVKYG
jgi:hypothetical protein